MKTAVSIPNALYRRTEGLARKLRKTRSAVYASALEDFVSKHDGEAITSAYDEVVREVGDEMRAFRHAVLRRASKRIRW